MRSSFVLAVGSVALSAPRVADACSPPACLAGAFVPGDGARVPANVPGLYWRPMSGNLTVDVGAVVLASTAAPDTPIPLTAQQLDDGNFLLVPGEPLVAGNHYTLTDRNTCDIGDGRGPQVSFEVTAAVPLPTDLGSLVVTRSGTDQIEVPTSSGSCSASVDVAQVSVGIAASAQTAPWLDVLHFETRVDGQHWGYHKTYALGRDIPGASELGRGQDLVYQVCSARDTHVGVGVSAGSHLVTMRARLPGTSRVIESPALEITVSCDDGPSTEEPGDPPATENPDAGDDGGCRAGGGAVAPWFFLALLALARRATVRTTASRRRECAARVRGGATPGIQEDQ